MPNEHPSLDLLERYFINHASEAESAVVERHVFSCRACFSRAASLDINALALTKASSMLTELESQGTRVLTVSAPEPDAPCVFLPVRTPQFEFRYAAVAATVLLTVATLSSVGLAPKEHTPAPAVSETVQVGTAPEKRIPAPALPSSEVSPRSQKGWAPKPSLEEQSETVVARIRFEKPFTPPSRRHIERPALNMAYAAPSVLAQERLEPPTVIPALPQVPKLRPRGSRRVLSALASPFKKLGGTVAAVAVGRSESNH